MYENASGTTTSQDNELGRLNARFDRAKELRRPWEGLFQECFDYALPAREGMHDQSRGASRVDDIYDETAVVGIQEFASRLQQGLVPNYSRWSEYYSGPDVPEEEIAEVDEKFEEITDIAFEAIHNSNFAQEVYEAFLDVGVGTGCLWVGDGDASSPIMCKAIPMGQLYLDNGPDDRIDLIGRERKIRLGHLRTMYPRAQLTKDLVDAIGEKPDKMCVIREATYRLPGPDEAYEFTLVSPEYEAILWKQRYLGSGSNPNICFRWAKLAGEVWGRGVLMNALPAIKTTNLTIQLILENADLAVSGVWQAEDDGIMNFDTVRVAPGTIIPVAPGSQGLKSIRSAADFNIAQLVLDDMRNNIKRALFNDMLGNPTGTPMSATEVHQRTADLQRRGGAAFGRLRAELVDPFLRRVLYILRRQGRISLPSASNRIVRIRSLSPLAQAQANEDILTVDRYLEMMGARFGPQMANIIIKQDETAAYVAEKMNIPKKLNRTQDEAKQFISQFSNQLSGGNPIGEPEGPPAGGGGGIA